MHRIELVGMLLIATIPVATLLGFMGPRVDRVSSNDKSVRLEVQYPSRMHHQAYEKLTARVVNQSEVSLPQIQLRLTEDYVLAFSEVSFAPPVERAYMVRLLDVQPGESRLVTVEIRAQRYGKHRGRVVAVHDGGEVAVDLDTFTYP
jgi:hypothetical protein